MKPDRAPNSAGATFDPLSLPEFAGRDDTRPMVVALEGANGAGKTTLCQRLALHFSAHPCMGTDEAWLADTFKTRMIRDAEWFVSAMFFLSGCLEQMRGLRECPQPLVIMDRSLWSTLAVHAAEDSGRLEILLGMLRPVAARIHVPDLTLVLDASLETCQSRIARKSGVARQLDELNANAAFHARERSYYAWLARQRGEVRFLDANPGEPETVAAQATALITAVVGPQLLTRASAGVAQSSARAAS